MSCGVGSSRASCASSTSRSSSWRAGPSPRSRRSCAGSTPSAG
jgi:hypothetical protein